VQDLTSDQAGRTLGVPRGLLRLLVLEMLSEKPMSGAEIVEQIAEQTAGRWKPSPGSIYPLLAWMQSKGFTEEAPTSKEGFKRYSFTAKGGKFLEKQIKMGETFLNKLEFLFPMFFGKLHFGSAKEKLKIAAEPARRLVSAFMVIRRNLDALSQDDAQEIVQAIDACSERLEKLSRRFKKEERN
jgi:DNA-binding PadR family transcriptional regulator